jgi:hypothetical protein
VRACLQGPSAAEQKRALKELSRREREVVDPCILAVALCSCSLLICVVRVCQVDMTDTERLYLEKGLPINHYGIGGESISIHHFLLP